MTGNVQASLRQNRIFEVLADEVPHDPRLILNTSKDSSQELAWKNVDENGSANKKSDVNNMSRNITLVLENLLKDYESSQLPSHGKGIVVFIYTVMNSSYCLQVKPKSQVKGYFKALNLMMYYSREMFKNMTCVLEIALGIFGKRAF